MNKVEFRAGRNIAMKVPPHQYEETVRFYREVLGFKQIDEFAPNVVFEFGSCNLWIDEVAAMSQAELWLEINADDTDAAAMQLEANAIVRCDEIEALPPGFDGFWISSPASIIHLVRKA